MKSGIRILAAIAAGACLLMTGCGSRKADTVSVQSVAMLNGVTPEMNLEKYAGIVTSGNVTAVKREDDRQIASVAVKTGDQVTQGQLLFTYDAESAQNDLDRQMLELQQIQNTITAKTAERNQLASDKKKAKADEQLDYTLKIQDADTDIREARYNLGLKQKEIAKSKTLLTDLTVTAPVAGTVTSVGSASSGSDSGSDDVSGEETGLTEDQGDAADSTVTSDDGSGTNNGNGSSGTGTSTFIRIEETGVLRVRGTINENNIGEVSTDMPMIVRSRTDDKKMWKGTVTSINTSKPVSDSNQNYYGNTDTMTQSSKYPFYVELDNPDGLIVGQHVYLEPDVGQEDESDTTIRLPADFIVDAATSTPVVWMEDEQGLLTTRGVKLGSYRESDNSYEIVSGLTLDDYIAYPDSSLKKGMKCKEQDTSDTDASSEADSMTGYADSETPVVFSDSSVEDSMTKEADQSENGEQNEAALSVEDGGAS